jgi:tRNA(Ile)-lysidine synthase
MMNADDADSALTSWEDATLAFLRDRGWNPSGAILLLAVSGGADSTALLRFFARRAGGFACKLHVAHIDHRLRASSALDLEFTAALCRELGVPFHSTALDPALRPPRSSTEMWARDARYRFFAETASRTGARFILTAHHRDDLVETVFQRLSRGTGPRGLAGIPFLRPLRIEGGECAVVRPFLSRTRAEILAYLALLGSPWREDESNAEERFERNRFRLRYLPALRRGEKDLDARVFALASRMQSLLPAIDNLEEASALLRVDGHGGACLPEPALAPLVAEDDCESLRYWLKRLVAASGARPNLVTQEILREFVRQWKESGDLQVPLAPTLALRRVNRSVYCANLVEEPRKRRARTEKKTCSSEEQRVILEAGVASHSWRWGDRTFRLTARSYPRPRQLVFPRSGEGKALFDADLFSCTLVVRTRRDGDRFSPFGVSSRSRKLKAFFNEEKIPPGIRDGIPIVLNEGTPAWVPGHGISEFFKVGGNTTRILELELENLHERHRRQEEQSGGR